MKSVSLVSILLFLATLFGLTPTPALADSSHARIVRLSLVQGDVRFTHEFHKDSMDDSKAVWEIAPMNLPIREGYAVGTDANGRAEVEFENGAMALLAANTVIEFYDLSLDNGARITRLDPAPGQRDFLCTSGAGRLLQRDRRGFQRGSQRAHALPPGQL